MDVRLVASAFVTGCLLLASPTRGNMVMIDFDITTDPEPGGAEIEPTITVNSGDNVSVDVIYLPGTPTGPPQINAFGFDLSWGLATDTAALNLVSVLAHFTAQQGFLNFGSNDAISGSTVGLFSPLERGSLVSLSGYSQNIGGAGFYDPGFTSFSGTADSSTVPLFISRVTFQATGPPGSSVTVTPSTGVLDSIDSPFTEFTLSQNSNFMFDILGDVGYPGTPVGGKILIAIPEASSFLYLCAAAGVSAPLMCIRARRRRAPSADVNAAGTA